MFHSEGGAGVWNVPWLNPYHLKAWVGFLYNLQQYAACQNVRTDLKALFQGELDDRTAPARVPWAQKKPVVYWRGALTAPDNIPVSEAGATKERDAEIGRAASENAQLVGAASPAFSSLSSGTAAQRAVPCLAF